MFALARRKPAVRGWDAEAATLEEAAPIFSFLSLSSSLFLSLDSTSRQNSFSKLPVRISYFRSMIFASISISCESREDGASRAKAAVGGEREGRSCRGEQVFYQTGCVPISRLVRTYRLVDTLADRRQLIKENSETICSREYPCRFLAVDF